MAQIAAAALFFGAIVAIGIALSHYVLPVIGFVVFVFALILVLWIAWQLLVIVCKTVGSHFAAAMKWCEQAAEPSAPAGNGTPASRLRGLAMAALIFFAYSVVICVALSALFLR